MEKQSLLKQYRVRLLMKNTKKSKRILNICFIMAENREQAILICRWGSLLCDILDCDEVPNPPQEYKVYEY